MDHAEPTLREGSGKGFLLHGRQMVLGGTPDGDSEVPEAETISDKWGPHFKEYFYLISESIVKVRTKL